MLAILPTTPQQADRPWWARTTLPLVLVPGVFVAVVVLWLRAIRRLVSGHSQILAIPLFGLFKGRSHRHRWAEESFKVVLEWQLRGLREREHTMLRVRSSAGTTVCRMASPVRAVPLSVGDRVELQGRHHRDGMLRVFKLYNCTTQSRFSPTFLAPQVVALCLVTAVFVVLLLDILISAG